jgi:hypothetical protein
MADFLRCPRCNRLFTVEDGGELPTHNRVDTRGVEADECVAKPPVNHYTHSFGTVDDCIRCLDCEVLYCGLQSGKPCPAHRERAELVGDPKQYNIPPVKPSVFGSHIQSRSEQSRFWDSDAGRYVDNN